MKNAVGISLVLLLCSFGWAQSPVPGTFSAPNSQVSAVIGGPLLTPPSVSLGSGQISQGQGMAMNAPMGYAGYANPVNGYVPMPRPALIAVAAPTATGAASSETGNRRFDYIVAPSGSGSLGEASGSGVGDTNLGQLAASLRKGPPPTQRTFTNEDIARMNGVSGNNYQMPGGSSTQPQYPQQQQKQKQQPQTQQPHSAVRGAPLPPGAKPSPFSRKPSTQGAQQTASDE